MRPVRVPELGGQVVGRAEGARGDLLDEAVDVAERHPELRVLVLTAKGLAQSRLGAPDAAAVSLTEVSAVTAAGCERPRIEALQHLALIEAHRGRLGHAERLAGEAIDCAARCGVASTARPVLAWVAMERYDVDAAGRHLRSADPKRHGGDDIVEAAFAMVKSRRLQARGELRAALTLLEEVAHAGPDLPPWLAREAAVSRGRLLIVMGRPAEALAIVEGFPEPYPPDVVVLQAAVLAAGGESDRARETVLPVLSGTGLSQPTVVEAWLLLATIAATLEQTDNARRALRHALRLAAHEAQRRPVQQVWTQLRRILREDELADQYPALHGGTAPAHRPAAPPGTAAGEPLVVDPLSRRELEVLQGMANMMPTEEIAATLYVSINTVKTHVRSILRKLSAARRNEAVRRARQLGII